MTKVVGIPQKLQVCSMKWSSSKSCSICLQRDFTRKKKVGDKDCKHHLQREMEASEWINGEEERTRVYTNGTTK